MRVRFLHGALVAIVCVFIARLFLGAPGSIERHQEHQVLEPQRLMRSERRIELMHEI